MFTAHKQQSQSILLKTLCMWFTYPLADLYIWMHLGHFALTNCCILDLVFKYSIVWSAELERKGSTLWQHRLHLNVGILYKS